MVRQLTYLALSITFVVGSVTFVQGDLNVFEWERVVRFVLVAVTVMVYWLLNIVTSINK